MQKVATKNELKTIARKNISKVLFTYRKVFKKSCNIIKPQTYQEKIQWLKMNDFDKNKTILTDKYLVRDYIKEKLGENYLNDIYGIYDKWEDINFDLLPDNFVLKTTHSSGWNCIVLNKNLSGVKNKINDWLSRNFALLGYEMHYYNIKPRILIEKYMNPNIYNKEYQVWVFSGKIKFIAIESNKTDENRIRFLCYPDGKKTEFSISPQKYKPIDMNVDINKLKKVIELADKIKIKTPIQRLDFAVSKDNILFREMTFTPGNGLSLTRPEKYSKIFGDWMDLNYRGEDE